MRANKYADVWGALEKNADEAANMKLRSRLMIAITDAMVAWRLPQTEAAKRLGITQPRLNDLLRGRIGKFSLDALVTIAAHAGLSVRIDVRKAA